LGGAFSASSDGEREAADQSHDDRRRCSTLPRHLVCRDIEQADLAGQARPGIFAMVLEPRAKPGYGAERPELRRRHIEAAGLAIATTSLSRDRQAWTDRQLKRPARRVLIGAGCKRSAARRGEVERPAGIVPAGVDHMKMIATAQLNRRKRTSDGREGRLTNEKKVESTSDGDVGEPPHPETVNPSARLPTHAATSHSRNIF
jgi:hypothetical protein